MPAYNAAAHVAEAIHSILQQSLQDFELIVVDDASTDDTAAVVNAIVDPRINLLRNETNKGVAFSLNKALQACTAPLIARMDADDIALPNRLEVQASFLEAHNHVTVVDVLQQYIDEDGSQLNKTNEVISGPDAIAGILPWRNCLGHPSVMYRADVISQYNYRQIVYEDYDLWLRLVNDGYAIEKLLQPLLLFRVHQSSITAKAARVNRHFKHIADTKWYYLSKLQVREYFRWFNIKVMIGCMQDYCTFCYKKLRQKLVAN